MKAILYERFGGIDVLHLGQVEAPSARAGEVLVRVQAASINPLDGKVRRGEMKLMSGLHFPKRPGQDFAGVVEAVGAGVEGLSAGDAVYGCVKSIGEGALAERIAVPAQAIARRPSSLDPIAAASAPVVAMAALQSLRDVAKVKRGDRVLVNGCTGGVGLFAIQLAKRMGAHVTGVCGADGVELARSFGADQVHDYRTRPIAEAGDRYDVLLELSGKLPFDQAHPLLGEHGVYVDFSPSPASLVGNVIANPFRSHKHLFVMTDARTADLDELAQLFDAGALRAPPTTVFSLEQFRDAFERAERGRLLGKVVVGVSA